MHIRPLLALGLLGLGNLALAEDSTLTPVRINGSVSDSLAAELPIGTVVLTRADLDEMPATTLSDVLDSVAGVQTSRFYGISGTTASIDLQGFGATANQNTLILLNGQRLSPIDTSSPDLAAIPLVAIERIEVLPGAGAALYGNGAVGGVINIITRQNYRNSAGLKAVGGSYATTGGSAYASGKGDRVGGALALNSLSSDGYRDNNEIRQHNAFADLRYQGDGMSAYLSAGGSHQEQGLPGGRTISASQNQYQDDPTGTNTPFDDAEQDNYWVMPGLSVQLPGHNALTLDFSRRHQTQDYRYVSLASQGKTTVDSYSVAPKLNGQLATGPVVHNWTLGFDLHDYDYQSRASFGDRDLDQTERAWYLHNLMALGSHWSVSAGARRLDSTLSGDGMRNEQDGEMYEGGVRYTIDGGLAFFAGAQRSVRIANVDELSPFNPPIDPQTGHTYTAGASWAQGRQHSTLTFWRAQIGNEIVYDPITGTNRNLDDDTRHQGISLNSRWKLDKDLALTINGSVQQARFDGGSYDRNDVPLVPESTLQLIADWQALPWLSAQIAHRYVGARYYDGDLANSQDKLDSYRTTDLQLTTRYRALYLQAGVYNLEGNHFADYGSYSSFSGNTSLYPLPDRHYLVTLGMEL
ncbi:TonB dependent receptor [Alcanivorax hongdengensis A-11-3]|uniref:TonB dependent receptor n=1 Tax=Alcanivorax hongdengensis A-11-3 TaxID=1177179 RepID=L0WB47_9GAMM|nr:TonB-dependent receptor [Alcanivorax hongdengensis]EKF74234.1 TonB dependent receptor [Alcanivorax hongdengensis A-11-3]